MYMYMCSIHGMQQLTVFKYIVYIIPQLSFFDYLLECTLCWSLRYILLLEKSESFIKYSKLVLFTVSLARWTREKILGGVHSDLIASSSVHVGH